MASLASTRVREPLLSVEQMVARLSGPSAIRPVLLDVRWQLGSSTGPADYERGHIPTARFVDLDSQLSAPVRPDGRGGRHPMPTASAFGAAMRAAGVRADRPVVCYDADTSIAASRAWWLLRHFGKDDVAVLDGGIAAWCAAGRSVESGPSPSVPAGDFVPRPSDWPLLDAEGAAACARDGVLLDGRPAHRYRGEDETVDPVAGHIPGAVSAPASEHVGADGRFRPLDQIADKLRAAGVRPGRPVGAYCGSGVQAAHLALVLTATGLVDRPAVYVGSWSDWITNPDRPVAQ